MRVLFPCEYPLKSSHFIKNDLFDAQLIKKSNVDRLVLFEFFVEQKNETFMRTPNEIMREKTEYCFFDMSYYHYATGGVQ